jgi:hypothetical protein
MGVRVIVATDAATLRPTIPASLSRTPSDPGSTTTFPPLPIRTLSLPRSF